MFDIVAACCMAEVADEELSDITHKKVEVYSEEFQDIGYYKDGQGRTRFGIIPGQGKHEEVGFSWDTHVEGYNIITNPNYR